MDDKHWSEILSLLESSFQAYTLYFFPQGSNQELGSRESKKQGQTAMMAFLHYFNTGFIATVEQVSRRIEDYIAPFQDGLELGDGLGAGDDLSICRWIHERLQGFADHLVELAEHEQRARNHLLDKADELNWTLDNIRSAAKNTDYDAAFTALVAGLESISLVQLKDLREAFPHSADRFWKRYTIARGDGPLLRYPTDQSIFDSHPLILAGDHSAICPIINTLYTAILESHERDLLSGKHRARYLRSRDKTLEKQTREIVSRILSPRGQIYSSVFEDSSSHFEHDIIAIDGDLCLVIEVKASPPIEPFRDPSKSFVRLRRSFRADTGIQKAFDQASRVVRKLRNGEAVSIHDAHGARLGVLDPTILTNVLAVCVTRDTFGPLATNLDLLLDKKEDESFPWVVNIVDLDSLAEAWGYLNWDTDRVGNYIRDRVDLHGHAYSDDELVFAGYYIHHGGFTAIGKSGKELTQLDPSYSDVFTDIYRHLHWSGPPVTINVKDPVLMDLKASLVAGQSVFVKPLAASREGKKIERNKPCPCGSGKKYKRCCAKARIC